MKVFADTYFWVAFLDDADPAHDLAVRLYQQFPPQQMLTSEVVLQETLTFFAAQGSYYRQQAALLALRSVLSADLRVASLSTSDFIEVVKFYGSRLDKEYSFADCHSIILMMQYRIRKVLSHDHHFTQAGFEILM